MPFNHLILCHPLFLCTQNSINGGWCRTIVFIIEKNPHLSGPGQFKLLFENSQLYFMNYSVVTIFMVFPVVMYGCESWTVKKAEHQRIDAFELWCWRRLLRVPWTVGRSNQSILKEISPGYSLEGLMLKLKFQYFGHLMQRADSLEKALMLGGIGGRRRKDDGG